VRATVERSELARAIRAVAWARPTVPAWKRIPGRTGEVLISVTDGWVVVEAASRTSAARERVAVTGGRRVGGRVFVQVHNLLRILKATSHCGLVTLSTGDLSKAHPREPPAPDLVLTWPAWQGASATFITANPARVDVPGFADDWAYSVSAEDVSRALPHLRFVLNQSFDDRLLYGTPALMVFPFREGVGLAGFAGEHACLVRVPGQVRCGTPVPIHARGLVNCVERVSPEERLLVHVAETGSSVRAAGSEASGTGLRFQSSDIAAMTEAMDTEPCAAVALPARQVLAGLRWLAASKQSLCRMTSGFDTGIVVTGCRSEKENGIDPGSYEMRIENSFCIGDIGQITMCTNALSAALRSTRDSTVVVNVLPGVGFVRLTFPRESGVTHLIKLMKPDHAAGESTVIDQPMPTAQTQSLVDAVGRRELVNT